MDSRAVLAGGIPTGLLGTGVGWFSSLPNVLLFGLLAGAITGYLTESWGNEMKDGAAAGVLAVAVTFVGIGFLAAGGRDFVSVYVFLFVAIPFYAIEGIVGAALVVRVFGSAVSRPS